MPSHSAGCAKPSSPPVVGVCQERALALPTARSCISHSLSGDRARGCSLRGGLLARCSLAVELALAGQGKVCAAAAAAIWFLSCQATSALPLLLSSSAGSIPVPAGAWIQPSCAGVGCATPVSLKAFLPGAKHCL